MIYSRSWRSTEKSIIAIVYVAMTTVRRTYSLKMVTALIRPEYLNVVLAALKEDDYIAGMTITKVRGFGRQKGHTVGDPEKDDINFVTKLKVELAVREWDVNAVMDVIGEAARTGQVGDGKIFISDASEVMRIRTGEKGLEAVVS